MANDGFAINFAPPRSGTLSLLAPAAFLALLLLIFVGLQPFVPPVEVASFGGVSQLAGGDTLRQICYLGVFAAILFAGFYERGTAAFRAIPATLALLLLWCLVSALWAAEPDIAFRRAGLAAIIVLSVLLSVETIGHAQAFRLWRIVLASVLVVNWISIPLVHTALHLPGEADPGLVGDWRGLYGHKNIAGAVCAITAMLFLFTRNGARNWIGILVAAAAIGFLVMTRSKSSLGFLPIALTAGGLYRLCWRRGLDRAILLVATSLLLLCVAIFVVFDANWIARILEDPAEFTGRAEIWQAELAYIRDHPLLGTGFGTFADTGGLSPLHNYVSGSWVEAVSHGHNGYLQLFVTTGAVGFLLAMTSLILLPLRRFWPLDASSDGFRALLFALFTFLVLHNFMESDFLEGDSVAWIAFLLAIAGLRDLDKSLTRPR